MSELVGDVVCLQSLDLAGRCAVCGVHHGTYQRGFERVFQAAAVDGRVGQRAPAGVDQGDAGLAGQAGGAQHAAPRSGAHSRPVLVATGTIVTMVKPDVHVF